MRTRNADTPKSAAGKKTPPARKTAAKAQPAASQLDLKVAPPKTVETKRVSAADRDMQVKKTETTPPTASNSQKSSVEEAEASAGTAKVTPAAKVGVVKKLVAKKSPGKANTPASAKSVSSHTRKSGGWVKAKVDALNKEKVADVKDVEFTKKNPISENDGKSEKEESHVEFEVCTVENVGEPSRKEESAVGGQEPAVENVEQRTNKQSAKEVEPDPNENEEDPIEEEDPVEEDPFEEEDPVEEVDPIKEDDPVEAEKSVVGEVGKSSENEPYCDVKEGVAVKGDQEEPMDNGDEEETSVEADNEVENVKEGLQGEDIEGVKDVYDGDEQMDDYGEKVDLGEHGEEELQRMMQRILQKKVRHWRISN
ncbi:nucleolin [Prunus yedoensis var. nudiflora]|uniref:Nucleolin n=1 Tax=Prunus yedoensis var. nudiflora TaxID=2094558 RepID=A0A314ZAC0_PRUYE|nr:nucleolin [Prunus yedoensis var. nudiflora]